MENKNQNEVAVFGGGCFWCTEAIFMRLKGVGKVTSGYAGGKIKDPNYYEVSEGTTGHAEVIKIEFDPQIISYETLLEVFFATHNPTTLNRQGADAGTQYRSIILYTTEEQKKEAEKYIQKLGASGDYDNPIVTEIKELDNFYDAETYHQKYYDTNKDAPYCQLVISPKIDKLLHTFGKLVKDDMKS
jgi:peptide-methionine (S)-S-oxide reductase